MGRTLYVSDLDGTLLGEDVKTSDYTNRAINELVERGLVFSYATARSYVTSSAVTEGIKGNIPVIVNNGSFVLENGTGKILWGSYFSPEEARERLELFLERGIYPLVYSYQEEREIFSYVDSRISSGLEFFLASRRRDPRNHPVSRPEQLFLGKVFGITCMEDEEKILPIYHERQEKWNCIYEVDRYSKSPWLELLPAQASKAHAIRKLKEMTGCHRVVVFGDGLNDVSMFMEADESYAVANAHEELKKLATGVIGSNEDDGVARWLMEYGDAD